MLQLPWASISRVTPQFLLKSLTVLDWLVPEASFSIRASVLNSVK